MLIIFVREYDLGRELFLNKSKVLDVVFNN